jgi:hypothetical protein
MAGRSAKLANVLLWPGFTALAIGSSNGSNISDDQRHADFSLSPALSPATRGRRVELRGGHAVLEYTAML